MALIICPECGEKISDKSTVCIHCGYPLQDDMKHVMTGQERTCIVNGDVYKLDWLINMLEVYSNEELDEIKVVCKHLMNTNQRQRMQYLAELLQTQQGKSLCSRTSEIVRTIREKLNLTQEMSHAFLHNILDNGCQIPEKFEGVKQSDWAKKQQRENPKVHCKYCGSTNVNKLRYNFYNFGKEWHCNNCGSDF